MFPKRLALRLERWLLEEHLLRVKVTVEFGSLASVPGSSQMLLTPVLDNLTSSSGVN